MRPYPFFFRAAVTVQFLNSQGAVSRVQGAVVVEILRISLIKKVTSSRFPIGRFMRQLSRQSDKPRLNSYVQRNKYLW